jgi:polyisoprenoid-binding protein YceI
MSLMTKSRVLMIGTAFAVMLLSACGGSAAAPTSVPAATSAPAQPTATTASAPAAAAATSAPASTAKADATTAPAAATESTAGITYKFIADQTKASYTVDEVFINQNNKLNTAIGVTNIVDGEITLDTKNPTNSKVGTITIDISKLTSDSGQRDNAIRRRWLESSRFPTVTFVPTKLDGLPGTYTAGQELTFKITGDMTVRETTKSVTFDVKAKLDGDTLSGIATTLIKMTDFGFPAPDMAGILKANEEAILTLEFAAKP